MDYITVAGTAIGSFAALFLLTKLMGHRQVSELSVFDYINGITIGSIAAELATELESPLKPLIALVLYALATVLFSVLTDRSVAMRKLISGEPLLIMDKGKLYRENMKKAKLDLHEFLCLCRQAGYFDLAAIQSAYFENNGKMSFLPISDQRPATPKDMGLQPQQETVFYSVIADGEVLPQNLKRLGLDENWLQTQLREKGCHDVREIFLGLCDCNKKLELYMIL